MSITSVAEGCSGGDDDWLSKTLLIYADRVIKIVRLIILWSIYIRWLALRQSMSKMTQNLTVTIFCNSRCIKYTWGTYTPIWIYNSLDAYLLLTVFIAIFYHFLYLLVKICILIIFLPLSNSLTKRFYQLLLNIIISLYNIYSICLSGCWVFCYHAFNSLKMFVLENSRQLLIQVYKKITIHYLSLVIGIQEEGRKIPLRRLLCQLKLLILLLIGIIYQVTMIEVCENCCYSKSIFFNLLW